MASPASESGRANYPMPFVRVEIAVMCVAEQRLHVLLARRAEAPHAGKWALPGGVLRIDLDRSLEAAAQRVMGERLGVELPSLRQLCAVGGPTRDPRASWALSVVYRALVPADALQPAAGKRIEALAWRPAEAAKEDQTLAFDHATSIGKAVAAARDDVDAFDMPFGLLSDAFTLGELQAACEQVLARRLDKSSFRRRIAERGLVEPVEGTLRGGAFRPAQLYRKAR